MTNEQMNDTEMSGTEMAGIVTLLGINFRVVSMHMMRDYNLSHIEKRMEPVPEEITKLLYNLLDYQDELVAKVNKTSPVAYKQTYYWDGKELPAQFTRVVIGRAFTENNQRTAWAAGKQNVYTTPEALGY